MEADKGWLMIRIGDWVNVSSGTGSLEYSRTKGHKTVVVVVIVMIRYSCCNLKMVAVVSN